MSILAETIKKIAHEFFANCSQTVVPEFANSLQNFLIRGQFVVDFAGMRTKILKFKKKDL